MFQEFFDAIKEKTGALYNVKENEMYEKMKVLEVSRYNLNNKSLQDRNLAYVGGYMARKWRYNFGKNCKRCIDCVIVDREATRYNAILIDRKNRGGLNYPSSHVIQLAGQCMDVIHNITQNKKHMEMFKEASTEGVVAMKVIKKIMMKRVVNCTILKNYLLIICPLCAADRKISISRHLVNTMSNIGCNKLAAYITRKMEINTITLSMAKTISKERKSTGELTNNTTVTNSGWK